MLLHLQQGKSIIPLSLSTVNYKKSVVTGLTDWNVNILARPRNTLLYFKRMSANLSHLRKHVIKKCQLSDFDNLEIIDKENDYQKILVRNMLQIIIRDFLWSNHWKAHSLDL